MQIPVIHMQGVTGSRPRIKQNTGELERIGHTANNSKLINKLKSNNNFGCRILSVDYKP